MALTRTTISMFPKIVVLYIFLCSSLGYAVENGKVLFGRDMVEERINKGRGSVLTEDDTTALLREAELWRAGLQNHAIDDRRALSLYWTAAAGIGPSAGIAMNQLAWIYLVPTKLANPVSVNKAFVDRIQKGNWREYQHPAEAQPGLANWLTVITKKYFGIHLSSLYFVTVGRRLGWIEQKSSSEFQFSESTPDQSRSAVVERDVEAALELWSRAANEGNPDAQYALSTHLASSVLLGREETGEALSLVNGFFAAAGGSSLAQMSLGYHHLMGYGVPKSCDAALSFYELAANQAVVSMRAISGDYPGLIVLPPGDSLGVRLSELDSKTGKETDKEVVDYLEAAALAGDASATLNLGHIHLAGNRGVVQDIDKAIGMYHRVFSMKGSSGSAAGILGALTYGGVGVTKSCEAAAEYWRIGEIAGDSVSLTGLGVYHSKQCGSNAANITRATEYWERAAQKGHMDALYLLGVHYLKNAEISGAGAVRASRAIAALPKDSTSVEESVGGGQARAAFLRDLPGREAAREVAAIARKEQRAKKSERTLEQRIKEATLNKVKLDPLKEKAVLAAEAEFAEKEEARWAQAALREEARLEADANMRDEAADKIKQTAEKKKELEAEAMLLTKTTSNHLHKAISCLSTASQHGHILALHQMGIIHTKGQGVARSCQNAVQAFKAVAERGEPTVSIMQAALSLFRQNDYTSARSLYVVAAEAGIEVAQSNAAWLLERGLKAGGWELPVNVCGELSREACEKATLRLWKLAAKQNNAEATLMVGDYSYYGRGGYSVTPAMFNKQVMEVIEGNPTMKKGLGCEGDPATAIKYYSMAADMKNPQAFFNLAYMYHIGIGVERDVHLAKRYYDAAAAAHPHAVWPAQVGLTLLSLESLINPNSEAMPTSLKKKNKELTWGNLDVSWSDELAAVDTIAVLVLSALLFLTISLRNHHREHRRLLAENDTVAPE